ncbi:MAG TPA: hypothetical protein VE093_45805 [Polyangiaceae bacterium]|nr:hypothetical protein [Polyangiaceae bacterium]
MRFRNVIFVLGLGAGIAPIVMAGCGGDETGAGSATSNMTTTTAASMTGGAACTPKDPQCNQVASECIALTDNSGAATAGLRMSQITITKPTVLAPGSIVGNLVANGVQMNLDKCNLTGGGTFSWLLQFDTASSKVVTGGAKPVSDPFGGYCFVNQILGGIQIAPVEADAPIAGGAFSADVGNITVPIFLDAAASTFVLMPLKQGKITGTLSGDNNCIGKYNADKLDPANACLAEPPETLQFENAGTLEGFITLEDADSVIIENLKQSLCVLLSGNAGMYGDAGTPNKCKRDMTGKIVFQGDWCEATNAAADAMCSDSSRLGAEFAASAVKVSGNCP